MSSKFTVRTNVRKQPYPKKYVSRKPRLVTTTDVARIARAVTLRQAETKSFLAAYNTTIGDNLLNVCNTTGQITQGTQNFNRIGEKIYLKSIRVKGLISNANNTSTGKTFRLTLFKSAENITATTVTNIVPTRIYKAGGATDVITAMIIDDNKVTELWDKTWVVQPTLVNGLVTSLDYELVDVTIPINRNETYFVDTSAYMKTSTYYIGVSAYEDNGILTPCKFQGYFEVNFKDM